MVKAYILVEIEAGKSEQLLKDLRAIPEVMAADAVIGPYDIIAVIEARDNNALGDFIRTRLQHLSGVKRTVTCLTF